MFSRPFVRPASSVAVVQSSTTLARDAQTVGVGRRATTGGEGRRRAGDGRGVERWARRALEVRRCSSRGGRGGLRLDCIDRVMGVGSEMADGDYVTRDQLRAELAELKVELIRWGVGVGVGLAA